MFDAVEARWARLPVWTVEWTAALAFRFKVVPSADRPVVREARRDGPIECLVLENARGRLTGYAFAFEQAAGLPHVAQYKNSVMASYAAGPPWPDGLAIVMSSPHVRVLRSGLPDVNPVYQVVLRHNEKAHA